MKAGPKAMPDSSRLPFHPADSLTGSQVIAEFCRQYVIVPRGTGALTPLLLRPWQVDLVGSVFDPPARPRLAGWMLPRGSGKSTLLAALGLHDLLLGQEGASVVVCATDERQAGIVHGQAVRMVELNPALESRIQVFKDRLVIPDRGASFVVLPAEPKRLEGLDFSLGILDEAGVADRRVFEVLALAQGKREVSTLLCIGTPSADPDSVLLTLRDAAMNDPTDTSLVWREFSAAAFTDHDVSCRHCWTLANPALGDFLHEDALAALLPPKMRESSFRRSRLCQFVQGGDDAFLAEGAWASVADPTRDVADNTEIVIALDGSFNSDATALVACTIDATDPHLFVVGLWEKPTDAPDTWQVDVLAVEDAIRLACKRFKVKEVTADPFRWTRTLQVLAAERLPISEFPQTAARMGPATSSLREAVINSQVTHDGNADLARHVANAVLRDDARGVRITKQTRNSKRRVDLAVTSVMAHARATHLATSKRPSRAFAF